MNQYLKPTVPFLVLLLTAISFGNSHFLQAQDAQSEQSPAPTPAPVKSKSDAVESKRDGTSSDPGSREASGTKSAGSQSKEPADAGNSAVNEVSLAEDQAVIKEQFKRFEKSMLDMAEFIRKTEPERADILIRAINNSKENGVFRDMEDLVKILTSEDQLGDAVERQGEVVTDLQSLLELLMSDDREKELAKEKARIEQYIKDLTKIIAGQKDVRAATERSDSSQSLTPRQEKLAEKTAELKKLIEDEDQKAAAEKAKSEQSSSEGAEKSPKDKSSKTPGDKKQSDNDAENSKPSEDDNKKPKPEGDSGSSEKPKKEPMKSDDASEDKNSDKPKDGSPEQQPGDKPQAGKSKPMPGDKGSPMPGDGESEPSENGESQSKESSGQQKPPSEKKQAREQLEKARDAMEKAIQKLQKEQKKEASGNQEEALQELQKAKEKLEEILRQIREQERQLQLAGLEARFQRMLAQQIAIYNDTVQIDKVAEAERTNTHQLKTEALSQQEADLVIEASKALVLMQEEGSAVAFPEAVEQMRFDMQTLVDHLKRQQVGALTQAIEMDVVNGLKEMIDALQEEQEKAKQEQQQQQQQQDGGGEQAEDELLKQIAELKMLKSLQLRINNRTAKLAQLYTGEQATKPEVVQQVRELSVRQSRIHKATYDLSTGKNR